MTATPKDPEIEFPNIATLESVIQQGVTPAAIATAIESSGMYGWDQYGRFRPYTNDSPEAKDALRLIANVYRFESGSYEPDEDRQHPLDSCAGDFDNPFQMYGWPGDLKPPFRSEEFNRHREVPSSATGDSKTNITLLVIVAALLKELKIDHKSSSSAGTIVRFVDLLGCRMTSATVKARLDKIDEDTIAAALVELQWAVNKRLLPNV